MGNGFPIASLKAVEVTVASHHSQLEACLRIGTGQESRDGLSPRQPHGERDSWRSC